MIKRPNDIPGFLNISGFVDEDPKFDDKQKPFSITTNLDENVFNWNDVYNWDPVSIKKEHDVEKMQNILNQFVKCKLTSTDFKFIQNPLVFRLLQILQIVIEYIAHSQIEIQTLYGKTVNENSQLKTSLSRYKCKNNRLVSALRNMKEVEKCPICSSYFDSSISLDRHIHKKHFKIYNLWSHVRENKEFIVEEEVNRLNKQIAALRILLKKRQKSNDNNQSKPKDEFVLTDNSKEEPTDQLNVFELLDTIDGTKKYIIDPDYQPFQKAVHHDDGPYLIFQQMSDYSITIEPQALIDEKKKKGKDNKYVKKAISYLEGSPKKDMLKNAEDHKNTDINFVTDAFRLRTGKKIRNHVHDQAHEVKMAHNESGPRWKLRKKIEKEIKKEVPEVVPQSTIHQMFDKLNYYTFDKLKEIKNDEAESESVEEEEEEEEGEIELTSANYSSLQCSSERAQYYSEGGGGTTRKEQAKPSLYNPKGFQFPIRNVKKDKIKDAFIKSSSNAEYESDPFEKSSEIDIPSKKEDSDKNQKENQSNNKSKVISEEFDDSYESNSISQIDFKKMAKSTPTSKAKDSTMNQNKKKEKTPKNTDQFMIEEEEEDKDDEPKDVIPNKKEIESEDSFDQLLHPTKSLPPSHRKKKRNKSKKAKNEPKDFQQSGNNNNNFQFEEEEEDVDDNDQEKNNPSKHNDFDSIQWDDSSGDENQSKLTKSGSNSNTQTDSQKETNKKASRKNH